MGEEEVNDLLESISIMKESYNSEIDALKNQHAKDIGDQQLLVEKQSEQKKIMQEVEELLEKISCIEEKNKSEIDALKEEHAQTTIQLEDVSKELQSEIEQRSKLIEDLQVEVIMLNREHAKAEDDYREKLAESKHDDMQKIEELQQKIAEKDDELKCSFEDLANKDCAFKLFEEMRQDFEADIKCLEEEKHETTTNFATERAELESKYNKDRGKFSLLRDHLEFKLKETQDTTIEMEGRFDEVESKLVLSNEEAISLRDTIYDLEIKKREIDTDNNDILVRLRDEISELTLEKDTMAIDMDEQLFLKNSELKIVEEEVNDLLESISIMKESYNSEIDALKNQHAKDIGDQQLLVEKQSEQKKIMQEVEELLEKNILH